MKYINEKALMEALGEDPGVEGLRVLNDLLSEWQMLELLKVKPRVEGDDCSPR